MAPGAQTGALHGWGLTLHYAISVGVPRAVVLCHAVLPMHADDPFKGLLGTTAAAAPGSTVAGAAAGGGSGSSSRFLLPPDPLTDASASLAAAFSRQDVLNLLAVLANKVGGRTAGLPCTAAVAFVTAWSAVGTSLRLTLSLPPHKGYTITRVGPLRPPALPNAAAGTPLITELATPFTGGEKTLI